MEPKPYSHTDSQEQEAKNVLESILDSHFEKSDIRTRDTHPNIDGTIELVDDKQIPIGKFDIQLKSIPKGSTSFNCETTLVAYSKTTIPVLLICVDCQNRVVYWKHIHPHMPEFIGKDNQKSFIIHFTKESDIIDKSRIYRHEWIEIARYYQECLEMYPSISAGEFKNTNLEKLEPLELEIFQKFIDTINGLLDNDFIAFKEILFPGIWKIGVGIISSDQHFLRYLIYSIPYKEPSPLVCKLSQKLLLDKWKKDAIAEIHSSKEYLVDPEKAGKKFVLERVERVLRSRLLPIYGVFLSSDILCNFIDLYYLTLGLKPHLKSYTVQEISIALNQYLPKIAETAVLTGIPVSSRKFTVDLDKLSSYLRNHSIALEVENRTMMGFSVGTDNFPISTANDSLKYLIANKITEINRYFGLRDIPLAQGSHWIWSGYSQENEINSVTHILNHSIEEYKAFISGNRLKLSNSPYLDPDISIVYEYEPAGITSHRGPELIEHVIENKYHKLPKVLVHVKNVDQYIVETSKFPNIVINGDKYESPLSSYMVADFFFHKNPFLNNIYRMLGEDLSKQYSIHFSLSQY